ncbi:MAG: tetratricopeptide repeat protein [Bacillota bacterium]|nr:tetratricopeptide repeat protein [Bacillota bacterium]
MLQIKKDVNCLNYIGCCYLETKQFTSAILTFNQLINICPDWDEPILNLGRVFIKQEKFSEALECLKKALIIDPNEEETYFYFGIYYFAMKEFNKAIDNYKKSIDIDNTIPEVHLNLGICYSKLEEYKAAIDEFDIAYNLNNKFNQLSDLQPFKGELLVVTHRSWFPNMSPFKVDANNIVEFAQKHLEIFGECFIGGDTIIISKENKQMWLFHHEGIYTYIEFNLCIG